MRQEVHPGLWLHTATGAILTVYVDDLMMAARLRDEAGLWGALEKVVEFGEQPTPIDKFLGGIHHFATQDGLTSLTVNMTRSLTPLVLRVHDAHRTGRHSGQARRGLWLSTHDALEGRPRPLTLDHAL